MDREGKINYVHDPRSKDATAALGAAALDRLSTDKAEHFRHMLARVFDEQRTISFELPLDQDDAGRWLAVSAGPIRRGETVSAAVLFYSDVTERRRADDALQRAEKMSALGTLVAGVAHEINNPLTYMRGNMELTTEDLRALLPTLPPEAADVLQRALKDQENVVQGIDRIEHITRALKRVARPQAVERRAEDVRVLIDSVLTVAQPRVPPGCRLDLRVETANAVRVNTAEMSQVLLNLVFNAADAVAGQKEATIRVHAFDGANGFVQIHVTDNGPGIPPETERKLFTPFFTTKTHGTGLGLAISHRIIADHGGQLTYARARPSGATFKIALPPSGPIPTPALDERDSAGPSANQPAAGELRV